MNKLLCGIDQGSSQTRKICLKSSFGKKEAVEDTGKSDKVVAIPAQFFTLRTFNFPFTDRKRLKQLIREELADRLLFPLENSLWDFITDGKGNALAFVAQKERLENFKAAQSPDFKFLEPEPLCLLKAARWSGVKDALLIDLGAQKSIFLGIKNGFPDYLRILLKGADDLKGTSPAPPEDIKDPGVKEFINELLNSSLLPSQLPYPAIYLSGGAAQISGIKEYLEEKYRLQAASLPLPEGFSPYRDAVAFGAALAGKTGEDSLEFFARVKVHQTNPLFFWGGLALLLLFLFSLNLGLSELNLKSQNQAYLDSVKAALKREFPQAKADVAPVSQFKALINQEISDRLKAQNSPLEYLYQLSGQIPDKGFKFYELNLADSQIELKGYAPTYQKMEQLRQNLKAELVEGKTQPDGRVKFNLRISREKS